MQDHFAGLPQSKKSAYILGKTSQLPNISKIICFLLSSLHFRICGHIFSVLSKKWGETRKSKDGF